MGGGGSTNGPTNPSHMGKRESPGADQCRSGSNSSTCVSRMLLPDGSRNEVSIPYGCGVGGSLNSTPRADSSSYAALQSSVSRNSVPPAPLATRSDNWALLASSSIGCPGTGISTSAGPPPGGATHSHRKLHASIVTSARTSHPSLSV